MKVYIYVTCLVILFYCSSCDDTREKKANYAFQDSYSLQIHDTIAFISDYKHDKSTNFILVSNKILLQQNTLDNSIYAFDLNSQEQLFKLIIPEYGPDKIGKIQGFNYHNADSIYVVVPHINQIKLIDSELNIIDVYNIGDAINSKTASFSQMPLLKFNNLLLVNCLPETDYHKDPRFVLFDMYNNTIIDQLNTAHFISNDYYDLLFTLNSTAKLSDDTFIISLGVNEKVFIYDVEEKQIIDSLVITSGKFSNTLPLPKAQNISMKERLARSYYNSIHKLMVEKSTFLLRTTTLSIEPYDLDGNLKSFFDKPKSVIIYDFSNRQKVGEYYLPKDVFHFRPGFVYDNRIYFQLNNPNSPDDENLMKFVGYAVTKR